MITGADLLYYIYVTACYAVVEYTYRQREEGGDDMIVLNNGCVPVVFEIGYGGVGERQYTGKVVARCGGLHPWVAWSMASDDMIHWDCYWGSYVGTKEEALKAYHLTQTYAWEPDHPIITT